MWINDEDLFPEIPFERGDLLKKLNKFAYHAKIKNLIHSISQQVSEIMDRMDGFPDDERLFRSAKEKKNYLSDKIRLDALRKQQVRLATKLTEIESSIKNDIVSSKE